ncbi:helix-turn-helix transcriptional regulator [Conexibacter sp. CPCC 206217]|uniref:helix-turn-helix domain-containing protein n=1 Tax=Conexibacter sp. CPCC 206217 TaxID=3064574 RepID=UPI00272205B0|nr:helix-turn-helix transcriptional regulator [Conexibacter sp. CPCC 206217]MDO8208983.1 helix-turn-helix transcriptional regulator [Conexibacter sp. CPCC 206217]
MPSQPDAADLEDRRILAQETLLLDAQELVVELMEKASLNRGQLARALDKSNGFITQLLSGERNMTLRTLSDLADATGHRIELRATSNAQPKRYAPLGTAILRDNGVEERVYRNAFMQYRAAPNTPVQIRQTSAPLAPHHQTRRRRAPKPAAWSTIPS